MIRAPLALAALLSATPLVHAENIDVLMSGVFPEQLATYIGYESVEREDIPVSAPVERKYLIVDFRFATGEPGAEQLQASVHKVCMTLLRDRELIGELTRAGYDMVSVAFDRHSQFDCL